MGLDIAKVTIIAVLAVFVRNDWVKVNVNKLSYSNVKPDCNIGAKPYSSGGNTIHNTTGVHVTIPSKTEQ